MSVLLASRTRRARGAIALPILHSRTARTVFPFAFDLLPLSNGDDVSGFTFVENVVQAGDADNPRKLLGNPICGMFVNEDQ